MAEPNSSLEASIANEKGSCDSSSESKNNCMQEVLTNWSQPAVKAGADQSIVAPNKYERPDIANGIFDPNAPISHFEQVAPGVYRSGRPNLDNGGPEALLEKVWGDSSYNADHAAHTTVIELRADPPPYARSTEQQDADEAAAEQQLGMNNKYFGMLTHKVPTPQFIQDVLDYIDQQVAAGNRVDFHCYHGTDRTGTIAAAYALTHDPQLEAMVRDNPDQAFQTVLKGMMDNGFDPVRMKELKQGVQDFVAYKHDQMTNTVDANTSSDNAQFLEFAPLWKNAA